jgi:hypothetical protein
MKHFIAPLPPMLDGSYSLKVAASGTIGKTAIRKLGFDEGMEDL